MSDEYTVRNEPDFEPVYDEDDVVSIRRGDLRALLDVATGSMDFGSGFLDNEQVEALRKVAAVLGVDPVVVTPSNFVCQYRGVHDWRPGSGGSGWVCRQCHQWVNSTEKPPAHFDLPSQGASQ